MYRLTVTLPMGDEVFYPMVKDAILEQPMGSLAVINRVGRVIDRYAPHAWIKVHYHDNEESLA